MIGKLYTAKNGTPHVVQVLDVVREFTKGEKMENTAITQQVFLQRQKLETIGRLSFYTDDLNFKRFSMELETFLEEYQEIKPPQQENFGEMLQNRFGDETPNEVPDKIKTNIKMRVTPAQSAKVQKICIENGIGWSWMIDSGDEYAIQHTDKPYLRITQVITWVATELVYEKVDNIEVDADLFIRTNGTCEENKLCGSEELKTIKASLEEIQADKPIQYQIGIDTFQRSKANQAAETRVEIAKFMIDKYNWRNKGQDIEDFKKIKDYCDFAIEALSEIKG